MVKRTKEYRLRETYIPSLEYDTFSALSESEIEQRGYKQRLRESVQNTKEFSTEEILIELARLKEQNQTLNEASLLDKVINKLKEGGVEKQKYRVWKLPVGRYGNENGNKRIYTKKLWENVRDRQQADWKRMIGLVDHPIEDDDPGRFQDAGIVWLDMDVGDDGLVYGIGSFVGKGKVAEEILDAGGRVGFSSSGFGEVDKFTKEVDPETYIIERLADIVIGPSQNVYGEASCPHTPEEFMADVHSGATIEFSKQTPLKERNIKEPRSKILKITETQTQGQQPTQAYNAVSQQPQQPAGNNAKPQIQPQQQPVQSQGQQPAQQPAQQPVQSQGNPQGNPPANGSNTNQIQESVNMSQKNGLSKIEEKAFRKYVEAFMAEAGALENPIKRLNECKDILSCFDEGNCPDLKAKLEESLKVEQDRLEKLVETTVQTEKDFGTDIGTFRENVEKRIGEGIFLKEQVVDYEKLIEGLSERNKKLSEENGTLRKLLSVKDKLAEKTIEKRNRLITNTASESDRLKENIVELTAKNERLNERILKYANANGHFEKENGVLMTKLKEAKQLLYESQTVIERQIGEAKKLAEAYIKAKKKIAFKNQEIEKLSENYKTSKERFNKLQESFSSYKQEVEDTYNPVAHMVPKSTERVGKYLNLREAQGSDVETYWQNQLEKYGENIKPFEHQIRDAKTLREATSAFLRNRTSIDPDFATAQPAEYAYRNRAERAKLYEAQGIEVPNPENWDVEKLNESFMEGLQKQGLL
jgi:hypothetical protein